MENEASEVAALKPRRDEKIMDLVAAAGVDVSRWAFKQDGTPVKNPRSNPNYCYEWAFGGENEPTVLCVWHRSISADRPIVYSGSVRQYALRLDPLTFDQTQPTHVRSRARDQARRARKFDSLLQRAFRRMEPLRVVVLDGDAKAQDELGWDASKVRYRRLDPVEWYVHTYDDGDGSFRLVRGIPLGPKVERASPSQPKYTDQFELPQSPNKTVAVGTVFLRSAEIRRAALARACGLCELCGAAGFLMEGDAIYLETHHVVPLSEGGPDAIWNVVALCPNDHRRAHFAKERADIRSQLIEHVKSRHPEAARAIDSFLAEKAMPTVTVPA